MKAVEAEDWIACQKGPLATYCSATAQVHSIGERPLLPVSDTLGRRTGYDGNLTRVSDTLYLGHCCD